MSKIIAAKKVKFEELLNNAGLKVTPLRLQLLNIMQNKDKPVKAYDLINQLSTEDHQMKPSVVYRILEDFLSNGIIHKIEKINSYTLCNHANAVECHGFQFICTNCGRNQEIGNDNILNLIQKTSKSIIFSLEKVILEIYGTCEQCKGTNLKA